MKKVTLIMPIYNAERFLKETLDSVLAQNYPNIEFIGVDDHSSDSTPKILNDYKSIFEQKGYSFLNIRCSKNRGLCAAINEGLKHFTGKFLAFPDADDYLMPNYVSSMVSALEKEPKSNWVRCNYIKVLESENREYEVEMPKQSIFYNDFYDFVSKTVPHNAWNMLVRSDYFIKNVGHEIYNSRLTQEWSILLPLSFHSDYTRCDEVLYRYYTRTNTMSSWIDKDIDYVTKHIDALHDINLKIISLLKPKPEQHETIKLALSIYYTHLKQNKYKQKKLTDDAKRMWEQLLSLSNNIIQQDFALSINDSGLIMLFALDSVLQIRSDDPCKTYNAVKDLLNKNYICVIDEQSESLLTAVHMAFGKPEEVINLKDLTNSKFSVNNKLPALLLIKNSKIAFDTMKTLHNTPSNLFVDFRTARKAIRGWAYQKRWKL